jgi:hypothetical protein
MRRGYRFVPHIFEVMPRNQDLEVPDY